MKELEGKKLLILGGFTLACDIVRAAQNLGAYVIVADYNAESPAKDIADKFVLISTLDIDALEKFCRKESVDGVTTGFVDILLQPCYDLCHRLGLPCYMTPKMIELSTNKVAFKNECDKYGVPVPQTYLVGDMIANEIYQKINYPVFVKPLDSSGSRGAGVCYNKAELDSRFAEALSYSTSHNAIIEDYITGREFLLDYIAVNGEFRLLSIFDRYMTPDRGSAVNYSNISMTPSRAIDKYLSEINNLVINMFKGLGFTDGLLFMQGYFDGKKITFFEMGCRLGGSYYNHQRACLGHNAIDMVVRYALKGTMTRDILSIPIDIARYQKKYALDCNYLLKGSNETIAQIVGLEEIRKMSCVIEIQQFHDVGYHYEKDRIVDKCIVNIEIVCNSREEVVEKVNYLNSTFDVFNERGESLLMTKLSPENLFKD